MDFPSREQMTRDSAKALAHALRQRGIDPNKLAKVPASGPMIQELPKGAWTPAQFLDNCEKLLIINPSIAYVPPMRTQILSAKVISEN